MIFFFLDRTTIAIDNEKVVTEIISIRTDILIYLYMIVNITFYFKFKSSYVLTRMISKFYTDSLLRTVKLGSDQLYLIKLHH